jgi:regulator of nonsense transcripts 1
MSFERVMVDEATQATEPAVLVPLTRGCRQLVLVGDHCQLPPTVLSTRAEEEGLGVPLFSRMVACGVPPFMLDTQYRMHPGISMFPSDLFYGKMFCASRQRAVEFSLYVINDTFSSFRWKIE